MKRALVLIVAALSIVAPACVQDGADAPVEASTGGTSRFSSVDGKLSLDVRFPDGGVHRGANVLALTPSSGGTRVERVEAFMPAHGHASKVTLEAGSDGASSASVDLFMPGRWDITVHLAADSQQGDVGFSVYVP